MEPELSDILAVPWEREGALLDEIRKDGIDDETVEKAVIAAVRLLKGVEGEFSPELIEKLGREMYPVANEKLNQADDEKKPDSEPDDDPDDDPDDTDKADLSDDDKKNLASRIIRRAKALGAAGATPDSPKVSKEDPEDSSAMDDGTTHDNEGGTMEVQVPVKKEDGSWDFSKVPEESRPFFQEMIEKAATAESELTSTKEKLEKAAERASEMENKLREKEYISKAQEYDVLAPADKLGLVLKEAAEKMTKESFEQLETVLKSAATRVETGDLFKELGSRALEDGTQTPDDPWAQIEAKASALVEKSGDLTKEQAIDRILKTAEGAALYAAYERKFLPASSRAMFGEMV